MSEDQRLEDAAYAAVMAVMKMIWPKQKERILKNIIIGIMQHMGWGEVKLSEDNDNRP